MKKAKEGADFTVDQVLSLCDEVVAAAPRCMGRVYAQSARRAFADYDEEGLQMQVQYILSNLKSWRGERARVVKAQLDAWQAAAFRRHAKKKKKKKEEAR